MPCVDPLNENYTKPNSVLLNNYHIHECQLSYTIVTQTMTIYGVEVLKLAHLLLNRHCARMQRLHKFSIRWFIAQ